jgi:hypothetical protein
MSYLLIYFLKLSFHLSDDSLQSLNLFFLLEVLLFLTLDCCFDFFEMFSLLDDCLFHSVDFFFGRFLLAAFGLDCFNFADEFFGFLFKFFDVGCLEGFFILAVSLFFLKNFYLLEILISFAGKLLNDSYVFVDFSLPTNGFFLQFVSYNFKTVAEFLSCFCQFFVSIVQINLSFF